MGDSQGKTGKVVRWTVGVAIVALVVATIAGWLTAAYRTATIAPAGSLEVNETRSVAADGVENVTIKGVSEAIRLTDSRDGTFDVRLTGTVATSDREAVPRLVTEMSGRTLRIVVDHKLGLTLGLRGAELVLEVSVPKSYSGPLAAESVSGAVAAASHSYASFSARTTSGAIELAALRASLLKARSVSGAVTAQGVSADSVELDSTSGRIEVNGEAQALAIHSVSGAISVRTTAQPSRVEVGTTSGMVRITLPRSSRFTLDARSTSGAVECGFPILVTRSGGSSRHELSGTVGGPNGGEVALRTTSGAISVISG